jgi:nucleoside-diphosphate-sugar epimerase
MRTLIVGCGYVGMALGSELVRRGHEVFGLRRTEVAEDELRAIGVVPLKGDITKPPNLARLPGDFDWMVNCVSSSRGDAGDYRRVYFEGMRNLLAWLSTKPPKKFVYTSSTSVYAQTDGSLVTESSLAEPETETARVLLETEQILMQAAKQNFPGIILRVAGIYGPGRGYWFKQFLQGEVKIEGKGERFLNMVHRDDVVGAIIAALEKGQPGEVYNVVDDEPVTQLDLFRWLASTLGKELPPIAEFGERAERKRGWTNKRVSNRKMRTDLGYQFKFPTFREGYTRNSLGIVESPGTQPGC